MQAVIWYGQSGWLWCQTDQAAFSGLGLLTMMVGILINVLCQHGMWLAVNEGNSTSMQGWQIYIFTLHTVNNHVVLSNLPSYMCSIWQLSNCLMTFNKCQIDCLHICNLHIAHMSICKCSIWQLSICLMTINKCQIDSLHMCKLHVVQVPICFAVCLSDYLGIVQHGIWLAVKGWHAC